MGTPAYTGSRGPCGRRPRSVPGVRQGPGVPPAAARPPTLVGRVFRGSTAVRSGRLTRHQLHSSAWGRLFPDVYACASLELTHELLAFAVTRILVPGAVAS